jgi:hypothetical protein
VGGRPGRRRSWGGSSAADRVPWYPARGAAAATARRRGRGWPTVTAAGSDAVTITGLLAPLAQLAEQRTLNPRVRGSSPWRRTRPDLSLFPFSVRGSPVPVAFRVAVAPRPVHPAKARFRSGQQPRGSADRWGLMAESGIGTLRIPRLGVGVQPPNPLPFLDALEESPPAPRPSSARILHLKGWLCRRVWSDGRRREARNAIPTLR